MIDPCRLRPPPAPVVLVETDDLRISFAAGNGETAEAVVSFTGVRQQLGGIQREEFVHSLRSASAIRDTYYITDKRGGWYNRDGCRIADFIRSELGGREVFCLGNSMGGFGAVLFSALCPNVRASLAFNPQFSVHPDLVPEETRWREFRDAIAAWTFRSCVPQPSESASRAFNHVICGGECAEDLVHARLIHEHAAAPTAVFVIEGCDHDLARQLQQRGILAPLIDAAFSSDPFPDAVARVIRLAGVRYEVWRPHSQDQR